MKAKQTMTAWFPAHIKPVRVGVYETKIEGLDNSGFSMWLGNGWGFTYQCEEYARVSVGLGFKDKIWRGLTKESK